MTTPNSAPAWVREINVVTIVENEPVAPLPATEQAAGGKGRYSGALTSYQTLVTWTVTAAKLGELKEILLVSSDYAHTNWQVTVGDIVWATDWIVSSAMPIIFEDLRLLAGKVVKVEAKSTDGTSITADAIIVAKVIG